MHRISLLLVQQWLSVIHVVGEIPVLSVVSHYSCLRDVGSFGDGVARKDLRSEDGLVHIIELLLKRRMTHSLWGERVPLLLLLHLLVVVADVLLVHLGREDVLDSILWEVLHNGLAKLVEENDALDTMFVLVDPFQPVVVARHGIVGLLLLLSTLLNAIVALLRLVGLHFLGLTCSAGLIVSGATTSSSSSSLTTSVVNTVVGLSHFVVTVTLFLTLTVILVSVVVALRLLGIVHCFLHLGKNRFVLQLDVDYAIGDVDNGLLVVERATASCG